MGGKIKEHDIVWVGRKLRNVPIKQKLPVYL
jgi:hypothetical protein